MRKITLFLIAVAALAFAAHAGQLSASPGTTTSVEPAIANSLSDLGTQDEPTEQTEPPMFNGLTEDGVQGFGVIIFDTEPDCTIYYRYVFEGEGYSEWMEYTDELWFTEPGHYRVEAYAVAMGKTVSEVYAYEFIVMPIVQPGDLNHDGILGIEDVTTLIDIIISNSTTTPECDVNQDGSVDIADVTDLIDYILAQ
jgi:hypothetical protein